MLPLTLNTATFPLIPWFFRSLDRTFHTNVTTIPKTRLSFMKLCMALNKQKAEAWGEQNVRDAVDLLEKCLVLDCSRRITAEEALDHPFFHPSASHSPRS
jgi:serine/threonine protein kinase